MSSEVQSVSGDDVDEDMKLVEHVAKSLRTGAGRSRSSSRFSCKNRLLGCQRKKTFLSPWTGCDSKGTGCGERNLKKRGSDLMPIGV